MGDNIDMKTKKVSVTIPEDVLQGVRQRAKQEGRSLSNMLSFLLAEGMKKKAA